MSKGKPMPILAFLKTARPFSRPEGERRRGKCQKIGRAEGLELRKPGSGKSDSRRIRARHQSYQVQFRTPISVDHGLVIQ